MYGCARMHVLCAGALSEPLVHACVLCWCLLEPLVLHPASKNWCACPLCFHGCPARAPLWRACHVTCARPPALQVDEQYAKDVALVHGTDAGREIENEYKSFMMELGGSVPRWGAGNLSLAACALGRRAGRSKGGSHTEHGSPVRKEAPLSQHVVPTMPLPARRAHDASACMPCPQCLSLRSVPTMPQPARDAHNASACT